MSPAGALVADGEAACEGSEKAARSLLAAPCAACNTVNEVAIPVDGGRSFTVKCYSCAALNRLTVDTGGGPIVAARTPSDWRDSGGDGDSASARQQQAAQPRGSASELLAAGLASVPLKKRAKSALALSLAAGSEAAAKRKGGQSAAPADRQAPPPAPAPAPPPPQPARTSSASKKVVVRTGHDVVALFHDGYFYGGTVDDAKMSDSAGGPAGGSGRGASFLVGWDDGDDPSWVEAHSVALASRVPLLREMAIGTRVLALWQGSVTVEDNDSEEEVWFAAEVVGEGRGAEELSLRWIDGGELFEAPPEAIRTFVSSIAAPLELRTRSGKSERGEGGASGCARGGARGGTAGRSKPSKRSRDAAEAGAEEAAADEALLAAAMAELRDAWRGAAPAEGPEARLQVDAQGVPGLHVATDVLSSAEVEALRTVLGAHRAWVQVTYGAAGRYHDLTSAAERVDFCPAEAEAEAEGEGSRLEGSRMWPLDETHAELLRLVEGRLRAVFAPTGLWGGAAPADGPAAVVPNALQLTRVSAFNHIANHYDVRDMWKEGIATLAWSELPTEGELRGEAFSLCMQLGAKKAGRRTVQVPLPPGSAYVLTGASQGATRTCSLRHVGRAACSCCWTHGVTLSGPARVSRQSLTLRALADDESDSDSEAEGGGGGGGDEPLASDGA